MEKYGCFEWEWNRNCGISRPFKIWIQKSVRSNMKIELSALEIKSCNQGEIGENISICNQGDYK